MGGAIIGYTISIWSSAVSHPLLDSYGTLRLGFFKWGIPKSPYLSILKWSNYLDDLRGTPPWLRKPPLGQSAVPSPTKPSAWLLFIRYHWVVTFLPPQRWMASAPMRNICWLMGWKCSSIHTCVYVYWCIDGENNDDDNNSNNSNKSNNKKEK